MIAKKIGYTKKELSEIRKSLGKEGLEDICLIVKMNTQAVRMVLFEPKRYNEKVFDAVATVLEERKQKHLAQKQRIKQAI
ncbi:hypothetical protein [Pedobacter ureilyticus]|uniref:Uncharacterized protein n=1 Tax=Pedobacter ureilyticus TaxID=1393051 RepID=A0ABW9J1R1_9SPHI|nr:hypothetical protein [Pedobacter helvus]